MVDRKRESTKKKKKTEKNNGGGGHELYDNGRADNNDEYKYRKRVRVYVGGYGVDELRAQEIS